MGHEIIVDKKLYLVFKGSNGETKRLTIARPQDKLKKIVAEAAMDKISESNLFENEDVLYIQLKKLLIIRRVELIFSAMMRIKIRMVVAYILNKGLLSLELI